MSKQAVSTRRERDPAGTRQRLVEATVQVMLKQGFAATTVDQICAEAGVTKGSFFHHFANKEAIGKAAVEAWGEMGSSFYAAAWDNHEAGPLAQINQMLEIMAGFTLREDDPCTCMVGMMSQELSATNPVMQAACAKELHHWTGKVAALLAAAKAQHAPTADFDPDAVAWFLNSLWQGSMLVGKTCQSQAMIRTNLQLARDHLDRLFAARS